VDNVTRDQLIVDTIEASIIVAKESLQKTWRAEM
jgi:hypothetical protein